MKLRQPIRLQLLEKALLLYTSLLLLTLLIIFVIEPSIYTKTLTSTGTTERYPLPALLFLVALTIFLGILMYGIIQHWRWLFWLLIIAYAGAVIQVPLECLYLIGALPNPYPDWYALLRALIGVTELCFAYWMIQTYRHRGVWAMGRTKKYYKETDSLSRL